MNCYLVDDDEAVRRSAAFMLRTAGYVVKTYAFGLQFLTEPMVLDGPINGDWFEAYVTRVLVPELRSGDVIIMDDLSSHKRASVRELIDQAGATLRFLPPYSPDFNPIE